MIEAIEVKNQEVMCLGCGRRAWRPVGEPGPCAVCGQPTKRTGRFKHVDIDEAALRRLSRAELLQAQPWVNEEEEEV